MSNKNFIKVKTGELIPLEIGMKLFIHNVNGNSRGNNTLKEVFLTKIGRKWMTFETHSGAAFQFDRDGWENSNYAHNSLYKSQESYEEHLKAKDLHRTLFNLIGSGSYGKFTVKQLKDAAAILGLEIDA